MSTADIVPIAIVLDERIGYTLWAPPWEEDDEEWQAFLGADDKVLMFESPGQLAQHLRSDAEHDLTDHPAWDDVSELSPRELVPDEDYVFDLDGVYELAGGAPDRWTVTELADALDMVARVAECCDDDQVVAPLSGIPEIGMLELGHEAFYGRSGEKAWDRVGRAVADEWDTVCQRLQGCLRWVEPVELDDDLAAAQAALDAGAAEEADTVDVDETEVEPDDELDDELDDEDLDDEDELDEDEDEDDLDEDDEADEDAEAVVADAADEPAAVAAGSTATNGAEPVAAGTAPTGNPRFWESVGILPIRVSTPKSTGYTLRCYVDDGARFMGADRRVWVFAEPDDLLEQVSTERPNDLTELATWAPLVKGVTGQGERLAVDTEDDYDLGALDRLIRGETPAAAWDADTLVSAADFLLDVAEYTGLAEVEELFGDDAVLGRVVSAAREDPDSAQLPNGDDRETLVREWTEALEAVATRLSWR